MKLKMNYKEVFYKDDLVPGERILALKTDADWISVQSEMACFGIRYAEEVVVENIEESNISGHLFVGIRTLGKIVSKDESVEGEKGILIIKKGQLIASL